MASFPDPLLSARLDYRLYDPDDRDFFADLFSRPDVVRYLPFGLLEGEELDKVLERRIGQGAFEEKMDRLNFVLRERTSGVRVGEVGLFLVNPEHKGGEIGYVVHPDFGGRGYAKEASRTMLQLAFDVFDLQRVVARCDERNLGSEAVMIAMGMRKEARFLENWLEEDGSWSNEINYGLLQREWRAANV